MSGSLFTALRRRIAADPRAALSANVPWMVTRPRAARRCKRIHRELSWALYPGLMDADLTDDSAATTDGDVLDNSGAGGAGRSGRRTRRTTLFPASTFEDALELPAAIFKMASGQMVRRITLLDELVKSPTSSATRQLITNSSKYGLTTGSYNAEMLGLTEAGLRVVGDTASAADRARACFDLAIQSVDIFKKLYEAYLDTRLPAQAVLVDKARELGIPEGDLTACVETFTVNAKYVGVLRSISRAERFISVDALVEDYTPADQPSTPPTVALPPAAPQTTRPRGAAATASGETSDDFDSACFYITPIGDEDSEARKHADLFMGSLVEPALSEFGLKVVRADQIGQAGMITRQIIEYIMHSRIGSRAGAHRRNRARAADPDGARSRRPPRGRVDGRRPVHPFARTHARHRQPYPPHVPSPLRHPVVRRCQPGRRRRLHGHRPRHRPPGRAIATANSWTLARHARHHIQHPRGTARHTVTVACGPN